MAGLTVTTAAPKHCSHLEPRKGRPPLRRSGSHPRLRGRGPRTPPSARHSRKGTSTPSSLHRLNAPEPQLPRGCTEPSLSLGARACSSRWGSELGRSRWRRTQNRLQRPRARPPTEGAVISVACPPTLIRLRLRPSPLVTESLRMTSPRKWGRRGNANTRMRKSNLPPPGNRTVTYSSKADDEGPTEKPC